MTQAEVVTPVGVGDVVRIVDEHYVEHVGLVTTVHGEFGKEYTPGVTWVPCINAVYVSKDASKRDPYGNQLERLSSLQHLSQGPNNMPKPGRYWENLS
jgi:hypothetical protein